MDKSLVLIALLRIKEDFGDDGSLFLASDLCLSKHSSQNQFGREMESRVNTSMKVIYSSKTWAMHPCHTVICQNATGPFISFFSAYS